MDTAFILELANRADLARVRGIGEVYSNLLEEAGVDSVKELANRRPDHLHSRLLEVNIRKRLTLHTPDFERVRSWVAQAKLLPKMIEY